MKSFIVIGLGRFGTETAKSLCRQGCEVLAIDTENELVNVISLPANSGSKSFTVYLIPESSTNAFYRIKAK